MHGFWHGIELPPKVNIFPASFSCNKALLFLLPISLFPGPHSLYDKLSSFTNKPCPFLGQIVHRLPLPVLNQNRCALFLGSTKSQPVSHNTILNKFVWRIIDFLPGTAVKYHSLRRFPNLPQILHRSGVSIVTCQFLLSETAGLSVNRTSFFILQ